MFEFLCVCVGCVCVYIWLVCGAYITDVLSRIREFSTLFLRVSCLCVCVCVYVCVCFALAAAIVVHYCSAFRAQHKSRSNCVAWCKCANGLRALAHWGGGILQVFFVECVYDRTCVQYIFIYKYTTHTHTHSFHSPLKLSVHYCMRVCMVCVCVRDII